MVLKTRLILLLTFINAFSILLAMGMLYIYGKINTSCGGDRNPYVRDQNPCVEDLYPVSGTGIAQAIVKNTALLCTQLIRYLCQSLFQDKYRPILLASVQLSIKSILSLSLVS